MPKKSVSVRLDARELSELRRLPGGTDSDRLRGLLMRSALTDQLLARVDLAVTSGVEQILSAVTGLRPAVVATAGAVGFMCRVGEKVLPEHSGGLKKVSGRIVDVLTSPSGGVEK